jgi:hypothetical protein
MQPLHVNIEDVEWSSAVAFYGKNIVYQEKEIVHLKILCDRRHEGGGITWLIKFTPPTGKLIKIVAVALSDEHVFVLEGNKSNKLGNPSKISGGYTLNPKGQTHSAMTASEMTALVIYTGEPDKLLSLEVTDIITSKKE